VQAPAGIETIVEQREIDLGPLAHARIPAVLIAHRRDLIAGQLMLVVVRDVASGAERRQPLAFLSPPGR
jgi:hypothetical protein